MTASKNYMLPALMQVRRLPLEKFVISFDNVKNNGKLFLSEFLLSDFKLSTEYGESGSQPPCSNSDGFG